MKNKVNQEKYDNFIEIINQFVPEIRKLKPGCKVMIETSDPDGDIEFEIGIYRFNFWKRDKYGHLNLYESVEDKEPFGTINKTIGCPINLSHIR